MSQLKLTADGGGGTVAIKGPASTTGNNDFELTVPGTASGTILTSNSSLGKILQVVNMVKTDAVSLQMSPTYADVSGFTISITPTSANSKIILSGSIVLESHQQYAFGKFVRNINGGSFSSPTGWVGDGAGNRTQSQFGNNYRSPGSPEALTPSPMAIYAVDTDHNTTNPITYKLQYRSSQGNYYIHFNRAHSDDDQVYVPRSCSHLTLMEVAV